MSRRCWSTRTRVAPAQAERLSCELPDVADIGFVWCAVRILVGPLIVVSIERLGMVDSIRRYLVGVDPYEPIFYPGAEPMENIRVSTARDARVVAVVPPVEPTHDVAALDTAISHQRSAVNTPICSPSGHGTTRRSTPSTNAWRRPPGSTSARAAMAHGGIVGC